MSTKTTVWLSPSGQCSCRMIIRLWMISRWKGTPVFRGIRICGVNSTPTAQDIREGPHESKLPLAVPRLYPRLRNGVWVVVLAERKALLHPLVTFAIVDRMQVRGDRSSLEQALRLMQPSLHNNPWRRGLSQVRTPRRNLDSAPQHLLGRKVLAEQRMIKERTGSLQLARIVLRRQRHCGGETLRDIPSAMRVGSF